MSCIQAVILGLVQGLAEFLPVSSSGHLVLAKHLLGIPDQSIFYDVILHVATLIPIFIVFRKEIWALIKNPFQKYVGLIIVGTVPAVIAALLFNKQLTSAFETVSFWLAGAFVLTGVFLLAADFFSAKLAKKAAKNSEGITWLDAVIIGVFQAVGITPGVSRSGSTISGALIRGLSREAAARFSFILAIPAILGSLVLEAGHAAAVPASEYLPMAMGFVVAMLTGYLAIRLMLKVIKACKLRYFAYYVFVIAIITGALSMR